MIDYINKDLFLQDSINKQWIITATKEENDETITVTTITNEDLLTESISLTESLSSSDGLMFGRCESSRIEFTVYNAVASVKGCKLTVDIVLNNDTENPVISPILDLSNVQEMGSLMSGLSPVASMNMASVVSSLHDTGTKQAELSSNQISELNFNSQKIEKAINDMSKEVRDTIMNAEIPLDVDVTVEADGDAIFRGVRKATAKFTKVNGYNPLVT